jgi:electron transport complex protein RnfG
MNSNVKQFLSLISSILIGAIVLFVSHKFTSERRASIKERAGVNAAKHVLPKSCRKIEALKGCDGIYKGLSATGKIIAYAVKAKDSHGYGGDIVLLVGFTPDFSITSYHALEHNESPGLGDKFAHADFIRQFRGLDASQKISLKKEGGSIDGITSATITSRSVCNAVNNAKKLLEKALAEKK